MSLHAFAREHNVHPNTLAYRMDVKGRTKEEALIEGLHLKRYTFRGQTLTLHAWAKIAGLSYRTLMFRVHHLHWPIELALTRSPGRKRTKAEQATILRMLIAFNPAMTTSTPRPQETFALPKGTGPGRRVRDLQSELSGVTA